MKLQHIIKKPLITEKSMASVAKGKYTFVVDVKATKPEVKKAIEKAFSVKVKKVHLMKMLGKLKKVGRSRKKYSKKTDWKKAIVSLKEGKIDIFEKADNK